MMKIEPYVDQLLLCSRYVVKRIGYDRINVNAGYLAYITLLSIVPMLTVLLSVLSSFSVFQNTGDAIQDFVITHFVPAAGDVVKSALYEFVSNTGKMSAVGGGFLFAVALMLISNIDKNLNYIWRVTEKRRAVFSFSMYWMILTLGPILVGMSIVISSYLTSLKLINNEALSLLYEIILRWLPFILSFAAFVGLYLLVPNKRVKLSHAIIGGVIAALLFEMSKKVFALYITQFPSYQLIYGALAAIPILFIWVYLCWLIVLVGAEITAALGERELWSETKEMVNCSPIQSEKQRERPNDCTDSKSE